MAHNFVAQLPIISKTDLRYGDRCGICRETYQTSTADGVAEVAVRLPCGHEFGQDCLKTWLSPDEGKNSCPLCRHELFPAVPPVEEAFIPIANDDFEVDWNDMARQLDAELSANDIVYRSPHFRDWLLYSQLLGQGADLPPWHPRSTDSGPHLDSSQEEALFQELRRRGAFLVLPMIVGLMESERDIWSFLRENGYSYDPIYAATADGCAWSQS